MNLREFAKSKVEVKGIELMSNRNLGEVQKLVGETIAVNDFDFIEKEGDRFVVFTIAEDTENFYFGGMALTDLFTEIEKNGLKEELKRDHLEVILSNRKSKNKRQYMAVEII